MILGIVAGGATAAPADELYNVVASLLNFDGGDGSTTFTDAKGRIWTAVGNAQLDTSQARFPGGASLLLDGTGDYITSPDASDVSFGGNDWDVEAHVRFNGDPGVGLQTIASHYDAAGNQRGWVVGLNANTLRLLYSTDGANAIIISAPWDPAGNTWYHVAVCRRGSTVYFFIDGAQLGTASIGAAVIFDANTPLAIGTQSLGADGNFNGWIGGVRITNHARHVSAFTAPTARFPTRFGDPYFDSVVSLLHFEGADGSIVFTDQNGRTWTRGGTAQIDTAQFKYGAASLLDPTGQSHILTPSHADFVFGTGDFTIELQLRPSTLTASADFLWDQRSSQFMMAPAIYTHSTGQIAYHAGGVDRIVSAAGVITTNTWRHVAVSRVGNQTRMFVEGAQVGATYTDNNDYTTGALVIGVAGDSLGSSFGLQGHVDELRVTKSVGRYVGAFSPLPYAFPDAA